MWCWENKISIIPWHLLYSFDGWGEKCPGGTDTVLVSGRFHRNKHIRPVSDTVQSVQFSHSVVSDSLWPHESQQPRHPCPSPTPRVYPNPYPSSQWYHPPISSSVIPFSPAPNPSQHWGLFQWVNSLHEVAKILEFQLQHQSFQWTPRTYLL